MFNYISSVYCLLFICGFLFQRHGCYGARAWQRDRQKVNNFINTYIYNIIIQ